MATDGAETAEMVAPDVAWREGLGSELAFSVFARSGGSALLHQRSLAPDDVQQVDLLLQVPVKGLQETHLLTMPSEALRTLLVPPGAAVHDRWPVMPLSFELLEYDTRGVPSDLQLSLESGAQQQWESGRTLSCDGTRKSQGLVRAQGTLLRRDTLQVLSAPHTVYAADTDKLKALSLRCLYALNFDSVDRELAASEHPGADGKAAVYFVGMGTGAHPTSEAGWLLLHLLPHLSDRVRDTADAAAEHLGVQGFIHAPADQAQPHLLVPKAHTEEVLDCIRNRVNHAACCLGARDDLRVRLVVQRTGSVSDASVGLRLRLRYLVVPRALQADPPAS